MPNSAAPLWTYNSLTSAGEIASGAATDFGVPVIGLLNATKFDARNELASVLSVTPPGAASQMKEILGEAHVKEADLAGKAFRDLGMELRSSGLMPVSTSLPESKQ
jgi:hypothetical protein